MRANFGGQNVLNENPTSESLLSCGQHRFAELIFAQYQKQLHASKDFWVWIRMLLSRSCAKEVGQQFFL